MQPNTDLLEELVRGIVQSVQPLRIILFGPAARGDTGPDSDVDVLGVMPDRVYRWKAAELIRRHLTHLKHAT